MSEYGPALFVSRVDGEPLDDTEQAAILDKIKTFAADLNIKEPMDDEPVEPFEYDYDGYEKNALGCVLWADYAFGQAPEFIQEEMNEDAESLGKNLAKKFEAEFPGTYTLQCYYVEV